MLSLKGDIFKDYTEENFKNILASKSKIISEVKISESGRKIFEYLKIITNCRLSKIFISLYYFK